MSVEYTRPPQIRPESVLYSQKETVNAIALMAIVNMLESNIEMVVDCASEYKTKEDIETVMNGTVDQAIDFLNDAMDELKAAVIERVRTGRLAARVKTMKFCDVDGELDDVDVYVTFE